MRATLPLHGPALGARDWAQAASSTAPVVATNHARDPIRDPASKISGVMATMPVVPLPTP